jgi:hypothetical protein
MVVIRYEAASCLRGGLPYRFIPIVPAAAFLAAWTWNIASPFAGVIALAIIAIEPRIDNMFYNSPRELEAMSLFPADWRRVVLVKNLSTLGLLLCSAGLLSAVTLYFSPRLPGAGDVAGAALYMSTAAFPMLTLGNEASLRYPRRGAGVISGGLSEAAWITLSMAVVSVPYLVITSLIELTWLCVPYALATALDWYFRSVPRTAARVMDRNNAVWMKTETSSSY